MKPAIIATILLSCVVALAQKAVDLKAEPHYHLLLENDQIRVFLLTLAADESAVVHFRHSFLTVTLQDGEVIIWDEGKSPIQHFQVHKEQTSFVWLTQEQQTKGVSGGFRKDRPANYRNITIEFLDPAVGWAQMGNGTISPPASMFLGGALVADVLLQPGDEFPVPEKPGAELVIPLRSSSERCEYRSHPQLDRRSGMDSCGHAIEVDQRWNGTGIFYRRATSPWRLHLFSVSPRRSAQQV